MGGLTSPKRSWTFQRPSLLKIESLKKHVSQVSGGDSERDVGEFVRANARRMGQKADLPYAEAFRSIEIRR